MAETPGPTSGPMTHSPASGRTTHSPAAGPILVLNGPNLNMLGTRQPEVYGAATLDDVVELCTRTAATFGHEVVTFQSNYEGALIERIHRARGAESGIVINPGGLTHTSVALRDALVIPELPIVEVHISNVHAREQFRHHSYISPIATAVIAGMGIHGYAAAIEFLSRSRRLDRPSTSNRG